MAKRIKQSAAEIERAAAVDNQRAWDLLVTRFDSKVVELSVYGEHSDSPHSLAIAEEAERAMDALHLEAVRTEWSIKSMTREIANARKAIEKFAVDLVAENGDPLYAMSWSSRVFESAAKVKAFSILLPILKTRGFDGAKAFAIKETLRLARSRPSSTSATSNLAEACETEAFASFADNIFIF